MIDVRLALPQRSPRPLSVPWIWRHPAAHGHQRVGDRVLGVVVGVDAEMRARYVLRDLADDALDLVRQRAAVGVAQHDPARAGLIGRLGDGERVVRVGLVAVEEMLAVDHRFAPAGDDRADRLRRSPSGSPRW